ncbi:MAG: HAD family hydrolase [Oscillospiraceae bacterium]|nr:HAD family hydrolase [Oscillospiraceae bacterium]
MTNARKAEIARLIESGDWIHVAGSRKTIKEHEYYPIVADLLDLNEVQALKDFRHHIVTNRLQHSLNVSYYNYRLCRLLRLDAESAARAGLLHDLYDYDTKRYTSGVHGLRHSAYHPMVALERAESIVPINDRERDMIVKHMWPVTPARPKYAETYVLTFVDKYCAVIEFLLPQPRRLHSWIKKRRSERKEKRREKAMMRSLNIS